MTDAQREKEASMAVETAMTLDIRRFEVISTSGSACKRAGCNTTMYVMRPKDVEEASFDINHCPVCAFRSVR